ncbi:hypothetical protein EH31_14645 [Erythrobacter longus]|uniref:Uncharacterized protein n=1 Tax=Erythrobacter longus TaxID=1044 RepID=A0A074MUG1_ERYLO|nr:hypothetical protein [Erythrobacter longus]KEO89262.1 hypothetical protein EH31_14645 [Erythrobacter longus]
MDLTPVFQVQVVGTGQLHVPPVEAKTGHIQKCLSQKSEMPVGKGENPRLTLMEIGRTPCCLVPPYVAVCGLLPFDFFIIENIDQPGKPTAPIIFQ